MGKYSDKEITLVNGDLVTVKLSKNMEEGGTSYSPEGCGYAFNSLEGTAKFLNTKIKELKEIKDNCKSEDTSNDKENEEVIDYELSEDNNSLDDSEYDMNGNDTDGHYDEDGDYWAEGHSELNCD